MNKKILQISLVISLILPFCRPAIALNESEAASGYNQAGALFRDGRFAEALARYEQLIDSGITHPDLYYNAANASYRTTMLGKAVLYLERALRLDPSDADALANLAFINSVKQDKEPVSDNAVLAFFSNHYNAVNSNSAARWSGMSFALAMLCATGILFVDGWKRLIAAAAAILCCLVFLVSTGMLIEKVHERNTVVEAVILDESVQAFSGPAADNTHIFTVHEGTKVVIQRSQDSWNLIRLGSGAGGWINADSVEKI